LAAALTATENLPSVVIAHVLAELLDARFGHSFAEWFRKRSPYQPAVGDPIPLDNPDLRRITDLPPTAPPWRLANRLDETRRLRLAGSWATQFRVVFDYSAFDALSGILTTDSIVATCHPNRDLDEFNLPMDRHAPAFPIGPTDLGAQRQRVEEVLGIASDAGASIAVLPELTVTENLAAELESWVREPGSLQLVVTGSFHGRDPQVPAHRVNRALTWIRGHPSPLWHDKHSPADRPVPEDITPQGWPELRVHVAADGWHLVIAICRDLLNPQAVHALCEVGANLVLVPSMSETLVAFGGPVGQLVGTTQAFVAVANNPSDWTDFESPDDLKWPARAVFGHPGFAQQTRQVHSTDTNPGVALLNVGTGRLDWHPIPTELPAPTGHYLRADVPPPPWIARLPQTAVPQEHTTTAVTLRSAAVLVLLSDGDNGVTTLLTTRAPDLTHYAGQLSFPGGAADPADEGPVGTALREANEEIGLDPSSVHIVGALPRFALPESGFIVTPILAWSNEPKFLHSPNPGEVSGVYEQPVAIESDGTALDGATPGLMTAAILDLLRANFAAEGATVSVSGTATE
jgi:8-oxo-dGTP pyrophosphatase MutT (NUDIX family)